MEKKLVMNHVHLAKSEHEKDILTNVTLTINFEVVYPFLIGMEKVIEYNRLVHWDSIETGPLNLDEVKNTIVDPEYKSIHNEDRFIFVTKVISPAGSQLANRIYYDNKNNLFFMIPDLDILYTSSIIGNKELMITGVIIGGTSIYNTNDPVDISFSVANLELFKFPKPKSNIKNISTIVNVYGLNYGNNGANLIYSEKSITNSNGFTDNYGIQFNTGDPTVAIELGNVNDIFLDNNIKIPVNMVYRNSIITYNTTSVGVINPNNEKLYLYIRF